MARQYNRRRKQTIPPFLPIIVVAFFLIGFVILFAQVRKEKSDAAKRYLDSQQQEKVDTPKAEQSSEGDGSETTIPAQEGTGMLSVALPAGTPSQVIDYEGFRVSFNSKNRTPNWVAWELRDHETSGANQRSNKFWADSRVSGTSIPDDYRRSGYDKGHMCPAADQKWSSTAMHDSFVMSNMVPQAGELNRGAWNTLENKTRDWARKKGALVVVAGPIYEPTDTETIGAGVRVPSGFFKVLLAPYASPMKGIAFVYPNMSAPGNMENYSMSIDELENLIGYDFFPTLSAEQQAQAEATTSFREWNRK